MINRDYLNLAIDNYPRTHQGQKHPMAAKSLNLVWVRVADPEQYSRVADQIARSPLYGDPAVKCETASSGISAFLDAYRDLIWGMRWLLAPAILVTLALVISNAISISVRERRMEMAVLKVLGFQPWQLLILVLGEALLIGVASGVVSAGGTYWVVNKMLGGLAFPIGFFPVFLIPRAALWWGLAIGRRHVAGRQHHARAVGSWRKSGRCLLESDLNVSSRSFFDSRIRLRLSTFNA